MRQFIYKWMVLTCVMTMFTVGSVSARQNAQSKIYMFGFAASFNDTIVHFTDVQEVDSAWLGKKGFLLGREYYSAQLRNYLKSSKEMPQRTCIVMYDKNRTKLEKKFIKMRKLYTTGKDGKKHFDVVYLNSGEFRFKPVDVTFEAEKPAKKKKK